MHLEVARFGIRVLDVQPGLTTSDCGAKMKQAGGMYGCTYSLLTNWYPRYKIAVRYGDLTQPKNLKPLVTSRTRVVYFETPVNPTMDLIDIGAIRSVIDRANQSRPDHKKILMIIDNTFATPYCQRPLQLGADMTLK